jgi:hypothetical protein
LSAADDGGSELGLRTLTLSEGAERVWRNLSDDVEAGSGVNGEFALVRDLAAKAAEHAGRIAGAIALVNDLNAAEIDGATMSRGAILAQWYVREALRLAKVTRADSACAKLRTYWSGCGSMGHRSSSGPFCSWGRANSGQSRGWSR